MIVNDFLIVLTVIVIVTVMMGLFCMLRIGEVIEGCHKKLDEIKEEVTKKH